MKGKNSKRSSVLFAQLQQEATTAMVKALAWQRYDTISEVTAVVMQSLMTASQKRPEIAGKIRHDLTRMREEAFREFTSK